MAHQHDLAAAVQLGDARRQRAQRDELRPLDAGDGRLMRLALGNTAASIPGRMSPDELAELFAGAAA